MKPYKLQTTRYTTDLRYSNLQMMCISSIETAAGRSHGEYEHAFAAQRVSPSHQQSAAGNGLRLGLQRLDPSSQS